jgi:hypothetical protein
MWHLVTTFQVVVCSFPKYVKLAKMAMVQIMGSVENEPFFSMLAFMKSKLCNYPFAPCCSDVCTMVLHFAKFSICKMY